MRIRISAALAAVLTCAFLAGCAFQEDVAPVSYKAAGGAQIGNGATVAVTVEDARTEDRTRISNKVNGYGMEMAAIRADRPVPDIIKDAMEAELRARGFAVGQGGPATKLSVNRFYAGFKTGFFSGDAVGDVKLHVLVTTASGQTVYERQIDATGEVNKIMLANGSNATAALSDGMTKAFTMLFDDPAFVAALTKPAVTASNAPNS
jgi:uncharacterized lipoprotein YajG